MFRQIYTDWPDRDSDLAFSRDPADFVLKNIIFGQRYDLGASNGKQVIENDLEYASIVSEQYVQWVFKSAPHDFPRQAANVKMVRQEWQF